MNTALMIVVDQGVDLKVLKGLQKEEKVRLQQVAGIEKDFKHVLDHGKPFTIGESTIGGPDMIADNNIESVRSLFGRNQDNDFLHIYSAYLIHANYFVTNDKTDFINNDHREKLEALMPGLKIRTLDEFLKEIGETE